MANDIEDVSKPTKLDHEGYREDTYGELVVGLRVEN